MSREIGSYQSNIIFSDKLNHFFDDDFKWFISGRSALDYIIKDIKLKKTIKKALLPSWCCDSMIEPFIRNNIDIEFYSIRIENGKLAKTINNNADILLYIDYFGFKDDYKNIEFDGIVINDITQSIFSYKDNKSDYVFCSLRKWAGFKTAGLAYAKNGFDYLYDYKENDEYFAKVENAMSNKEKYLNYQSNNKDYYNTFVECENELYDLYSFKANSKDIKDAEYLNIEELINKRRSNAQLLLDNFKQLAIFKELETNSCPLYVPIIVPDNKKDALQKYLVKHDIYCPTHWKLTSMHNINEEDKYIYDNELSLICDQRYTNEDMYKIIEMINIFFNGEQKC